MKIVYFIDGFRRGGKERRLLELLKAIQKENIDYRIVVIHPEIQYDIPRDIMDKIIQIKKSSKIAYGPFVEFYKVCKMFKPDIIHTWTGLVTLYSLPAKLFLKIKLINSQIGAAPNNYKRRYLIDFIPFLLSDVIISNSIAGLNIYKPPRSKSFVIYNGLDFTRISNLTEKDVIREKIGIKTKNIIGMFASFSPSKDYNVFLRVAELVLAQKDNIIFIGVGEGNYSYYQKKIPPNLVEGIKFYPAWKDVENLMNICEIGIQFTTLNGHGEGISNSLLELAALGKPIIATDSGGTRELVNNAFGILVKDNDPIKIATAIMNIMENPGMKIVMGNEARLTVQNKFDIKKMVEGYVEKYRECLN